MAACLYAWNLGTLPEVDVKTTRDGRIVCLHDDTLARTTDAPDTVREIPVSELTYERIRRFDAGAWFDKRFEGQHVPLLEEVFLCMKEDRPREIYLDLKGTDLGHLTDETARYGVEERVIVCTCHRHECERFRSLAPRVRTMLWIGGAAEQVKDRFENLAGQGFTGLDQVQLHLSVAVKNGTLCYSVGSGFLREAIRRTQEAGVVLQVFPADFDPESVRDLLDLGIRWYATDEPKRFLECSRSCSTAD